MIVGITGKMGSGKSTAIEAMKTLGRPVCLHKFAGPLYLIQEYIYRVIAPVYTRPEDFKKDRKLLQWLGTDWGRESISQSLWSDLWQKRAKQVQAQDAEVIIVSDDTRFDNEAETVRALGGYVIQIVRNDASAHAEGGGGIEEHLSEAGIRPELVDYTIENTGSVEEFQQAFRDLVKKIEGTETQGA